MVFYLPSFATSTCPGLGTLDGTNHYPLYHRMARYDRAPSSTSGEVLHFGALHHYGPDVIDLFTRLKDEEGPLAGALDELDRRPTTPAYRDMIHALIQDPDSPKARARAALLVDDLLSRPERYRELVDILRRPSPESDVMVSEIFIAVWTLMREKLGREILTDRIFTSNLAQLLVHPRAVLEPQFNARGDISAAFLDKFVGNGNVLLFGLAHELGHRLHFSMGYTSRTSYPDGVLEAVAEIVALGFLDALGKPEIATEGMERMLVNELDPKARVKGYAGRAMVRNLIPRVRPGVSLLHVDPAFRFAELVPATIEILKEHREKAIPGTKWLWLGDLARELREKLAATQPLSPPRPSIIH